MFMILTPKLIKANSVKKTDSQNSEPKNGLKLIKKNNSKMNKNI